MNNKTEKWLSKKLRTGFERIRLRSFEACGLADVPDLYAIAGRGKTFWLELKVVESNRCLIPFRKGQPSWIEDYEDDGGVVFILVLNRKNGWLYLMWSADRIRQLVSMKLSDAYEVFGIGLGVNTLASGWEKSLEITLGAEISSILGQSSSGSRPF